MQINMKYHQALLIFYYLYNNNIYKYYKVDIITLCFVIIEHKHYKLNVNEYCGRQMLILSGYYI